MTVAGDVDPPRLGIGRHLGAQRHGGRCGIVGRQHEVRE
jgi:hypothetical protein